MQKAETSKVFIYKMRQAAAAAKQEATYLVQHLSASSSRFTLRAAQAAHTNAAAAVRLLQPHCHSLQGYLCGKVIQWEQWHAKLGNCFQMSWWMTSTLINSWSFGLILENSSWEKKKFPDSVRNNSWARMLKISLKSFCDGLKYATYTWLNKSIHESHQFFNNGKYGELK